MNISLIGMSGAGKSYIGSLLAKDFAWDFLDIDSQMEKRYEKSLPSILTTLGESEFLKVQECQVLAIENTDELVISPGGSVVYSEDAMRHLAEISRIIYLKPPLENIVSRISTDERGIVGLGDKTFQELFSERDALYSKYADVTITDVDAQVIIKRITALITLLKQ